MVGEAPVARSSATSLAKSSRGSFEAEMTHFPFDEAQTRVPWPSGILYAFEVCTNAIAVESPLRYSSYSSGERTPISARRSIASESGTSSL